MNINKLQDGKWQKRGESKKQSTTTVASLLLALTGDHVRTLLLQL